MIKHKKLAKCHPERPMRALGLCNSCYAKDFYKRCPERRQIARDRVNRWRAKNPEWSKRLEIEKHLRRKFGITTEIYQRMYEAQGGVCKLCGKLETTRVRDNKEQRLAVDHCHKTGKIRGLLCFKCNTNLAWIESNPNSLILITAYLS